LEAVPVGVAFKTTGGAPLPSIPVKRTVRGARHGAQREILRRRLPLPFGFPDFVGFAFPRVLLARRQGPERARELAKALYRAYFVDDVDISSADNTVAVCAKFG